MRVIFKQRANHRAAARVAVLGIGGVGLELDRLVIGFAGVFPVVVVLVVEGLREGFLNRIGVGVFARGFQQRGDLGFLRINFQGVLPLGDRSVPILCFEGGLRGGVG